MLSMEQRQTKALELAQLSKELEKYPNAILKQLPADMQKKIRSYKALGPLTSSGIEHVPALRKRIEWAIFYLTDPNFPQNFDAKWQKKKASLQQAQQAPIRAPQHNFNNPVHNTATTPPTQSPRPQSPNAGELDFGAFDPRKT